MTAVVLMNKKVVKGLTPIIAIVLLLMMTIAAFGLAYVWLTSFQKQTQSEVQAVVKEKLAQLGTQLEILSVYYDSTNSRTDIVVYNNGKNIIPADLLTNMVVLVDKKRVSGTVSTSTTTDIPPNGNFDIYIDTNIFNQLKDNRLHTITVKMGDIEISYPCGPIPPSGEDVCG